MAKDPRHDLIDHFGQFITEHKKNLVEEVLNQRTRHVTLVLEDIFQSQNASAVFRTAECYGLQDIYLIENVNKFSLSKGVLKGANKWLNLIHYNQEENNTLNCFNHLKHMGYRILATSPDAALTIDEIDVSQKVAIVLGNELHGLSDLATKNADAKVRIPMHGFTESFNLSVSAAIIVSHYISKLKSSDVPWQLTDEERFQLKLTWYKKLIKNAQIIEKEFLKSIK